MTNLYLIGSASGEPVKIGVSFNVKKRLCSLQTGYHSKLSIIKKWKLNPEGAYRVETLVHDALSAYRLNGEWFNCIHGLAIIEIERIIETTKRGADLSGYTKEKHTYVKCPKAQRAGQSSAAKALAESKIGTDAIKARWGMPRKTWPTPVLLEDANKAIGKKGRMAYNTAVKNLGPRPIAQYNYQAAQKRKAKREARG